MEQQTGNGVILVFPNPAIDEIKIQNNSLDKIDAIEIKNIQGISVLKKEINSIEKEITLNISNFPVGVYLLSVQQEEKKHIVKFIKNIRL